MPVFNALVVTKSDQSDANDWMGNAGVSGTTFGVPLVPSALPSDTNPETHLLACAPFEANFPGIISGFLAAFPSAQHHQTGNVRSPAPGVNGVDAWLVSINLQKQVLSNP